QHRQRAAGVVAGGARAVKLTPLAAHTPEAVRAALAARGWEAQPAWFAATGVQCLVVLLEGVTEPEREALVRWSAKAGADVLTGEGWALVSAAASRLAPLARPDRLPPGLEDLAPELGRFLASYADPPRRWEIAGRALSLDHPVLIGIVNVTPDSFSDGGRFSTVDRAVAQAERLVAEGCELLDVGGESTRPGAAPVAAPEEIARVAPVIEQLARRGLGPVSVDTRKAAVARAALAAGAAVINDVSGLAFDPDLARVVAEGGAGAIVMHMRGTPDTMDGLGAYRAGAAVSGARTPRAPGRGCGWPAPRRAGRAHRELRSLPVPDPAVLAGRGRDPARRVRDLPLPAVPGGDAGDADRGRRDDPVDRLLRIAARQVHDDQRAALLRVHVRGVRGRGGVPAGVAERPGPAGAVAVHAAV